MRVVGLAKRWDATSGLAPVSFSAGMGEIVLVRGRSGTGKSTLLALLAGWCEPDGGTIDRVGEWADQGGWRRWDRTAVVPQVLSPLAELSVAENVELVLRLLGAQRQVAEPQAAEVLAQLDLHELAARAATETSLGQQQRLAVAPPWSPGRPSSWPTSRPATRTPATPRLVLAALRSCAAGGARSSSPATRRSCRPPPTGSSISTTPPGRPRRGERRAASARVGQTWLVPYNQLGRVVHDADAHIMETPTLAAGPRRPWPPGPDRAARARGRQRAEADR